MIVTYRREPGTPLTPEQIKRLDALKDRPIVFDEDSPELTPEAIEGFRKAAHERNRRLQELGSA